MLPPRGRIKKNRHASQAKQRNKDDVEFRRHRVQQQNAIALLPSCALQLPSNARRRSIQFTKTVSTVAISMHVDDGRAVAHLRDALQQDLGDIHFAKSFE